MSALAMILAAATVVPGDGPERASGELVEPRPQPLDLTGHWRAVLYDEEGQIRKGEVVFIDDRFGVRVPAKSGGMMVLGFGKVVDEGGGNFRTERHLGIYEQNGGRLRICIGPIRPTSFEAGKRQCLVELYRFYPNIGQSPNRFRSYRPDK